MWVAYATGWPRGFFMLDRREAGSRAGRRPCAGKPSSSAPGPEGGKHFDGALEKRLETTPAAATQ